MVCARHLCCNGKTNYYTRIFLVIFQRTLLIKGQYWLKIIFKRNTQRRTNSCADSVLSFYVIRRPRYKTSLLVLCRVTREVFSYVTRRRAMAQGLSCLTPVLVLLPWRPTTMKNRVLENLPVIFYTDEKIFIRLRDQDDEYCVWPCCISQGAERCVECNGNVYYINLRFVSWGSHILYQNISCVVCGEYLRH